MEVNKEDILYIANLAYLKIEDDKIDKLTEDMKNVINFAHKLSEYNLEDISEDEFIDSGDFSFALRKDEAKESDCTRQEMLSNAPSQKACCFSVPKVVE